MDRQCRRINRKQCPARCRARVSTVLERVQTRSGVRTEGIICVAPRLRPCGERGGAACDCTGTYCRCSGASGYESTRVGVCGGCGERLGERGRSLLLRCPAASKSNPESLENRHWEVLRRKINALSGWTVWLARSSASVASAYTHESALGSGGDALLRTRSTGPW